MEYVKKYWFVALIALLFCVAIGYFAASESKSEFKGKQVNGADVVFEYNGQDITADSLYEESFENQAPALGLNFLQMGVYANSMETTKEMEETAQGYYDNYIAYMKYYYGENYKETLLASLRTLGYDSIEGLKDYYITRLKIEKLEKDYLNAHVDDYWPAYEVKNHPCLISHILVKMADSNNPTEEELAKVKQVEDALAEGKDFAEVATQFSDDSSAANGGSLGLVTDSTSFVPSFRAAADKLQEGEVTQDWVVSEYGYHMIKCDARSYETLIENEDFFEAYLEDTGIESKVFVDELEKHSINYHGNKVIEDYITKLVNEAKEAK